MLEAYAAASQPAGCFREFDVLFLVCCGTWLGLSLGFFVGVVLGRFSDRDSGKDTRIWAASDGGGEPDVVTAMARNQVIRLATKRRA
jgi:hypothetical protein